MKSSSRNNDKIIDVLLFQQNYASNLFLGICKKETAYALNYYASLESILFSTVDETWLSVQGIPLRLWGKRHMPALSRMTATNIIQVYLRKGGSEGNGPMARTNLSLRQCSCISV